MSVLTPSRIATRVQRQFGDESGVQMTNDDVVRWINDAQREAFSQHENLRQAVTQMNLTAGTDVYNMTTAMLTIQAIRVLQDASSTSYYDLRYMSEAAFAELINGSSGSDYPQDIPVFYTRGDTSNTFRIWPIPETTISNGMEVVYSRNSTDIADLNGVLDLPEYYHQYVLEYCLMKAYEMDEDWEAADKKAAYVQSTLDFNNNREGWFGRKTYPVISPVDEDYW